ncbi:hypothetical protein ACPCBC_32710 [Streptomyces incarnatus]
MIVSTRANTRRGARAIRAWLALHDFPRLTVTDRKVNAVAYIDDRAVPYHRLANWDSCKAQLARLTKR